jgi:hypothetical protein
MNAGCDDHLLVQEVQELRSEANGHGAELKAGTSLDDVPGVIVKTEGRR